VAGKVEGKDRTGADWSRRLKWGVKAAVAREVAAASKGLTWAGATRVGLTEVVSPNEASEIMTRIALGSAIRTSVLSALPALVFGEAVQIELYAYDRAATSLANDIYTVLSRSR
jgi:hypothetical protein